MLYSNGLLPNPDGNIGTRFDNGSTKNTGIFGTTMPKVVYYCDLFVYTCKNLY